MTATNNQYIVDRINRENLRMANMEQKASPWFWVALAVIVILLIARVDDERTIAEANKMIAHQEFSAQQSSAILADLMNGRKYDADGKVLSCTVK